VGLHGGELDLVGATQWSVWTIYEAFSADLVVCVGLGKEHRVLALWTSVGRNRRLCFWFLLGCVPTPAASRFF
jgi:hypothetical protein